MLQRIRNFLIIVAIVGIFYFLLSNHVLFYSVTSFELLKKSEPSFKYTFVSLRAVNPEKLLRNDTLRADGIGELLVERGLLTQQKADAILRQINRE